MNYGELKAFVLQLLNQYSVAGQEIALTYNNQADVVARIPGLVRDALYYVATTARRLRTAAELAEPERRGGWLIYDLPEDVYQLIGGLVRCDGSRCWAYRVVGGRQVLVPASEAGQLVVEYYRYPSVPAGIPEDDDFLDCPPEAQTAVAYYVAAHLAMEDNNFLYGSLYNEFEAKVSRLQAGYLAEQAVTEDVYA